MAEHLEVAGRVRRERAINAPWTVAALIFALLVAHGVRVLTHTDAEPFAATSADLAAMRPLPFVTYQFVHGGWAHVLVNAAFVLAFGAPVGRYLGSGWRGAPAFFAFFLLCGVIAGVGYGLMTDVVAAIVHTPQTGWALVGASGSASGLMGGAVRLMQGHGRVGSLRGRTVAGMSAAWIVINIILGVTGLSPGAGEAPVAWEAHIIGFFAGLLLIGPFGLVTGVRHNAPFGRAQF
jgi:membrane associated rhomboid family serine protease